MAFGPRKVCLAYTNSVGSYVPIYLVSKNEMILKSNFWVFKYTVDGWIDKRTDRAKPKYVPSKDGSIKMSFIWTAEFSQS